MAYEYPSEFWQADGKYMTALEQKDYYNIIKYGLETISIANSLEGKKNTTMIAVRYNEVAMAYAELGEYELAKRYNQILYDYASQFGEECYEYKKAAETRILQYGSTSAMNYVKTNISYGSWSNWQNERITPVEGKVEVETRTVSSPKKYHYVHWCTGNLSDSSKRYRTSSHKWCDEAIYHDLGWFDYPLPYSEDSTDDYAYIVDGVKQRCSNSCFRWYLVETSGGDYTQYRSRKITKTYVYWEWTDWSTYSTSNPYNRYGYSDIDVDERKMYRYKEK